MNPKNYIIIYLSVTKAYIPMSMYTTEDESVLKRATV